MRRALALALLALALAPAVAVAGVSSAQATVVATRLGALELAGAVMSLPGGLVARTV